LDALPSRRNYFKANYEAIKKKKLKEIKKLKQFSPYFVNAFKAERRQASKILDTEKKGNSDERTTGTYNRKLLKVYGINKTQKAMSKKRLNNGA
jgi:hypothetical protein